MPITPDTKSWTWVLDRECPECGFDAASTSEREVAGILRSNAAAWPGVLKRADVTVRPDSDTWSALEYGAHVRDVFVVFAGRLALMVDSDDPLYANWDQDEAAISGRYSELDPGVVSAEIVAAGTIIADAFDRLPEAAWDRPGRRSDGASFTVATFARYLAHDPLHHLWDVQRSV